MQSFVISPLVFRLGMDGFSPKPPALVMQSYVQVTLAKSQLKYLVPKIANLATIICKHIPLSVSMTLEIIIAGHSRLSWRLPLQLL